MPVLVFFSGRVTSASTDVRYCTFEFRTFGGFPLVCLAHYAQTQLEGGKIRPRLLCSQFTGSDTAHGQLLPCSIYELTE